MFKNIISLKAFWWYFNMQKHGMFIFNIKFLEKTEVSGIAEHFSKWGLTGDLKLGKGRGVSRWGGGGGLKRAFS